MARIVVESQENGPYLVIVDGKPLASICRCGLSSTKPICDGSHERSGFTAPGTPVKEPELPRTVAPVVEPEAPVNEAPLMKAGGPVIRAEFPANVAPAIKPQLPVSAAPVMKTELRFTVATPLGELDKTPASPAETRNVCQSCGHVNPKWVRSYCVRCAARLRMD